MKLITYRIGTDGETYLQNNPDLKNLGLEVICKPRLINNTEPPDPEDLDADIIGAFVDSKLTKSALEQFKNLKLVVTLSTGYDHIDLSFCKEKNIPVCTVPAYGEHTVAEYTFALILALTKQINPARANITEPGIRRSNKIIGTDLLGKTIGVIGTGKIGKNTIKLAHAFGMKIIAYDVIKDETYAAEMNYTYVPLENLLSQSDIVSVHVPYLKQTHHLLNQNTLPLMKATAYLINTSRGAVIETEALYNLLAQNKITGAGLDVLEEENATFADDANLLTDNSESTKENQLRIVQLNKKIIAMPNVIVTPHNASNTKEAHNRIFETTVQNIKNFFSGTPTNTISL